MSLHGTLLLIIPTIALCLALAHGVLITALHVGQKFVCLFGGHLEQQA